MASHRTVRVDGAWDQTWAPLEEGRPGRFLVVVAGCLLARRRVVDGVVGGCSADADADAESGGGGVDSGAVLAAREAARVLTMADAGGG